MGTAYQEQAKVFKALCDPKRLAILEQLRSGEKCACVLQEPLDLTQSGLSYHMKILCDSGIVVSRQEGTPLTSATGPTRYSPLAKFPPFSSLQSCFEEP